MSRLVVRLFGPFQVFLHDRPVDQFESARVKALLAYLAIKGSSPLSRSALAEMLWPNRPPSVARNNFKQALANLRKAIGDRQADLPFILATYRTVQHDPRSDCWLDVREFQRLMNWVSRHSHRALECCQVCLARCLQAILLMRGPFLEHLALSGSPSFEEWALILRERYYQQANRAFSALALHYELNGQYSQAYEIVCRQLEFAPWDESAHMSGMRLLALMGRRAAALRQFEVCKRTLRRELDVPPSPEALRLYDEIRSGPSAASAGHPPRPHSSSERG
jgi:DNA-binding SARP family transcriptional activator